MRSWAASRGPWGSVCGISAPLRLGSDALGPRSAPRPGGDLLLLATRTAGLSRGRGELVPAVLAVAQCPGGEGLLQNEAGSPTQRVGLWPLLSKTPGLALPGGSPGSQEPLSFSYVKLRATKKEGTLLAGALEAAVLCIQSGTLRCVQTCLSVLLVENVLDDCPTTV